MPKTLHRAPPAFTLIELLVVMAVIGILATLAIPTFTGVTERARVTQDLSNLRQIGIATQLHLNDNDNTLFSTATPWMGQLRPKYLPAWKIFQSPFDNRAASEIDPAPVSYGLNGNAVAGTSVDKIKSPSVFILFGPAQNDQNSTAFSGTSSTASPGVTVYKDLSNGTTAIGGTQNSRKRINALYADMHSENILWTDFKSDSGSVASPCYRWDAAGKTSP